MRNAFASGLGRALGVGRRIASSARRALSRSAARTSGS